MPRPRILRVRLALAAAIALTAPAARAAEALRWAPKKGETLRYALSQVFDVKIAGPGQESSHKSELDVDLTWKIDSVADDGTIELTQTLDRARTRITAPGQALAYDSQDKKAAESPATQIWVKAYEAVLGKPYAIKLSPQGEVLDVKLPDGAANALADSPLAQSADAGSFFSPAGVKTLLAQILPKLPKVPVGKGATWDSDLSVPSGTVRIDFKTRYTLAGSGPVATIDATIDSTVTPAPEAKVTVKVTRQDGTAKFAFDPAAGRLDSATIKQSADMTLSDGNADVNQTTEAKLTFKLVK